MACVNILDYELLNIFTGKFKCCLNTVVYLDCMPYLRMSESEGETEIVHVYLNEQKHSKSQIFHMNNHIEYPTEHTYYIMQTQGRFIVIEGLDGIGKSTTIG